MMLNVEYAGAAPGLVVGVTQINVTLPDVVPTVYGYPAGDLPLEVTESGVPFFSGSIVSVFVSSN
jgi:uncharacterized protein (TIGR03437 family)